jgi:hypothetical protein
MSLTQGQSRSLGRQTHNKLGIDMLRAFHGELLLTIPSPAENFTRLIDAASMLRPSLNSQGIAGEIRDRCGLILSHERTAKTQLSLTVFTPTENGAITAHATGKTITGAQTAYGTETFDERYFQSALRAGKIRATHLPIHEEGADFILLQG